MQISYTFYHDLCPVFLCIFSQYFFLTLFHEHIFAHPALFPLLVALPASLSLTSSHSPPAVVLGLHRQLGTAHYGKWLDCCDSRSKLLPVALLLPKGPLETCCLFATIVPALLLEQEEMHPTGQVLRGKDVPRAMLCFAALIQLTALQRSSTVGMRRGCGGHFSDSSQ